MACKKVLLVEDDSDLRESITEILELEGYQVITSENGKKAWELLRSLQREDLPNCIVLDLMMPVMDGKTFLEALSKSPSTELGNIRVLVTTAQACSKQFEVTLPLNPEIVYKPVDLEDLLAAVKRQCGAAA